jgi:hypothetical protein
MYFTGVFLCAVQYELFLAAHLLHKVRATRALRARTAARVVHGIGRCAHQDLDLGGVPAGRRLRAGHFIADPIIQLQLVCADTVPLGVTGLRSQHHLLSNARFPTRCQHVRNTTTMTPNTCGHASMTHQSVAGAQVPVLYRTVHKASHQKVQRADRRALRLSGKEGQRWVLCCRRRLSGRPPPSIVFTISSWYGIHCRYTLVRPSFRFGIFLPPAAVRLLSR